MSRAARGGKAVVATACLMMLAVPALVGSPSSSSRVPSSSSPRVAEPTLAPAVQGTEMEQLPVTTVVEVSARLGSRATASVTRALGAAGDVGAIPAPAQSAYQRAAVLVAGVAPRCGLEWPVLAAIAEVESDHGRLEGVSSPRIIGAALDGGGARPRVADTDAGEHDDDVVWDHAVGPMQILPAAWAVAGVDGDGDGVRSPHDIDDAALAVAVWLCAAGSSLDQQRELRAALLRYNDSRAYVDLVMAYVGEYRSMVLDPAPALPWTGSVPVVAPASPTADRHAAAVRDRSTSEPAAAVVATGDQSTPTADVPLAAPAEPAPDGATSPKTSGEQPQQPTTPPTTASPTSEATASPSAEPVGEPAPPAPPATEPEPDATGSRVPAPTAGPASPEPPASPDPEPATPSPAAPKPSPEPEPEVEPEPEPKPEPKPVPPAPEPKPEPTPEPKPEPEPGPVTLEGVWAVCDSGYCLDSTPLLLGERRTGPAAADHDGDGQVEVEEAELAGLVGQVVSVDVTRTPEGAVVASVNGIAR